MRTVTLLKQQRIWNIQNRRDLRFTEREKVAHHRTDYQVTLSIVWFEPDLKGQNLGI
jgi:hypothetical protein